MGNVASAGPPCSGMFGTGLQTAGSPFEDTVVGGHERILRQTVIAMVKGAVLAEHENPGEATVYVLRGRVRLSAGAQSASSVAGKSSQHADAERCAKTASPALLRERA